MNEAALAPIWKALSDPTRRSILDLLKRQARTTGELCSSFNVSRFAVMKHLSVLENAGLVVVRREGRHRWNYLNAVPLQQMYERWLRPYEAHWAASLIRLQQVVEQEGDRNVMPQVTAPTKAPGSLFIEQEIKLNASTRKVFAALTGDLSSWWGAPYLQDAKNAKSVHLEPKLGGRFLEKWSEDEGAIWAVVTNLKKNERIILHGSMAMPGAVYGTIRFDLEDEKGTTRLKLSHHAVGEVNEDLQEGYRGGWEDLLGLRLKSFVETGEKMGIGHEPPTA